MVLTPWPQAQVRPSKYHPPSQFVKRKKAPHGEEEEKFFGKREEAVSGGPGRAEGRVVETGPKGWESQRVRALGGRGGRWRERLFFRRGAVSAPAL
jgi:hypothetical protein